MQPLPLANGFYKSDSLPLSAQECLNAYPNLPQAPALNMETVFGTPGLTQLATTGALFEDNNRGAHKLGAVPYFVNGTTLYRLNSDYSLDSLGTISGTGRVSIADNGTQLMILVPGGSGYIFTIDPDTLTTISDPDFTANGAPQQVVYIDGYFVCTTDSKKFIVSDANNGLSWDALLFGTAEADPDDIVAPIVFNNELYIAGTQTLEGFNNRGGADFPFERTGLYVPKGVSSPFSIINANNTFMWIGGDANESPAVWSIAGNIPEKLSTTAIDSILSGLTADQLSEVFSYSYADSGAYFVCFTLPTTTICIDTITGRWHERKSRISVDGSIELQRFRVNSLVTAYGKVLVGDNQDGRIGALSLDTYDEYGEEILRRVATQPFQNNMASMFIPVLELTMESGVGDTSTLDPQVVMDRSLDGKTFFSARKRSMGKIGEYQKRQIWTKNGRAKRFETFRFTMTDKVKFVLIQLSANLLPGEK